MRRILGAIIAGLLAIAADAAYAAGPPSQAYYPVSTPPGSTAPGTVLMLAQPSGPAQAVSTTNPMPTLGSSSDPGTAAIIAELQLLLAQIVANSCTNGAPCPTTGVTATEANGTVATGGVVQNLNGTTVPLNKYDLVNNSGNIMCLTDDGSTPTYSSALGRCTNGYQCAPAGGECTPPDGMKPPSYVQLLGQTTGDPFYYRYW
jgi:hypothetical protein